jgi:sulfite reductase (NADPH) flavoprotein alpha-component
LREAIAPFTPTPADSVMLDLLEDAPEFCGRLTPQSFVEMLGKLQPRLYSVASSMLVHGEVAHLFVSSVQYTSRNRVWKGVCTSYLAERLALRETVPVFVQPARHFHLPADPGAAVIMIGAGTGVAPFRAFLEERTALGCPGRNWLFLGQLHEATGFYYREDWLRFLNSGILTRLDTAFAEDCQQWKRMQDRLLERGSDLWQWINDGAFIYLCGDARMLAPAVDAVLARIAGQHGGLSCEQAQAFVQTLRDRKQYRRDVY